jgi:hypothetical protein
MNRIYVSPSKLKNGAALPELWSPPAYEPCDIPGCCDVAPGVKS